MFICFCTLVAYMFCFVWFDSLRPINNLTVIKGRVFLGRTSTKLGLMFLLKDTTQWRRWGSNPRPFGLESSTLPLSHCAPIAYMLNGHSKIDKTKILMTNGSLLKVESIAECSPWSILQYFWPASSNNWSWKQIFGLFESRCFTQVVLYYKQYGPR